MARSRLIKPGFFKNEYLVSMPMATRLLFAGLWTLADREGRLEDRPLKIKMEVFPADDIDVDAALTQLASAPEPFIVRYESQGVRLIEVVNWHQHQKPHHQEKDSVLPSPEQVRTKARSSSVKQAKRSVKVTSNKKQVTREGETEGESPLEPSPEVRFLAAWNSAPGVKTVARMSDGRRKSLNARAAEKIGELPWLDALESAIREKFPLKCTQGRDGWLPDGDWILKPDSLLKVIEGKYDWARGSPNGDPRGNLAVRDQLLAELEG